MIDVTINRDRQRMIHSFTMSGHAHFAEPGQDIVCSAASGISFGTINAIEKLLNVRLSIQMEQKSGFLQCVVPNELDESTQEKLQLLLESMVVSLQSVEAEYGQYIQLREIDEAANK